MPVSFVRLVFFLCFSRRRIRSADRDPPDGYRREATWAATLGAVGKWAIHPSQIEIANDVFSPTQPEIDQARKMSEAYWAAEKQGAGAAGAGGMLVDAAAVRIFEGILERARLAGKLSGMEAEGRLP